MKKEIVDTYFNNVKWFNEFFDGISQIFNSLIDDLSSEYNLENKDSFIYYPKANARPGIPSYVSLGIKLKYTLQIFAILNDDLLSKNTNFKNEPSFFFVIHKLDEFWYRSMLTLRNENVEYIDNFDDIHHGKFRDKKPLPAEQEDFYCFQLLLDSFEDKDSIKKTIHNDIIIKINLIFEKIDALDCV